MILSVDVDNVQWTVKKKMIRKEKKENIFADGCSVQSSGPIKVFLYWKFGDFFSHIHCEDKWDALHHGIVFFSSLAWQNRRRVFISLRNGSVSVT